ncbi:MAG: flagellar M-ring protein FliF [Oscillospiraceae bacterium]|nr:flagellar M-ring protein FliF [Oscillospiraceae bacterium]
MGATISSAWKSITEFFARLTKKQKIQAAVVAAVFIILAAVIAVVLGHVNYVVLYSGLTSQEAGEIIAALTDMDVPYKTEAGGVILVPESQAVDIGYSLAGSGFQSSDFGTAFLDAAAGFSMTDSDKLTYWTLQRQDYIKTMIMRLNKVETCLVMLDPPKDTAFVLQANAKEATASVLLTTKNDVPLTAAEANSIRQMVVTAVSGMKPENITILDSNINLYLIDGGVDEDQAVEATEKMLLERQTRTDMENQIVALLTPVFGYGKVRASVNVRLDFDDVKSETIEFAPPVEGELQGMYRSMMEQYGITYEDEDAAGIPGTDTNGMGTAEYPYGDLAEGATYQSILREFNYEMNQTTTQITQAKGAVSELTVAVLLDSEAVGDDFTDLVRDLVVNAIGVSDNRYVSVQSLPFQSTDNEITDALRVQEDYRQAEESRALTRTIIICATALLLLLMIILLLRSILRNAQTRGAPQYALAGGGTVGEFDYTVGDEDDDLESLLADPPDTVSPLLNPLPDNIDELKLLIDRDPNAVAQLLRNWLIEE